MPVPNTERETLAALCRQVEADLNTAHRVICELQQLDPKVHSWPAWSPQANTLQWVTEIREKFGLSP